MANVNDWSDKDKQSVGTYLKWNSYLSEGHKIYYVATPKVACTTLKWWLATLEGYYDALRNTSGSQESDPDLAIHDTFPTVAPDIVGLDLPSLSKALSSNEYFRFAVVRNPYKRLFSAWQSKLLLQEPLQVGPYTSCEFYNYQIKTPADIAIAFEKFLEHLFTNEAPAYLDHHWAPQVTLLRPDIISYTQLTKIEESEKLSNALTQWLGGDIPEPFQGRRTNESLIPYTSDVVTERSSELIRTLYAPDFEILGYDKSPPESKTTFTAEQFNIAIKAVQLIRGRHQRLGEHNIERVRLKRMCMEYEQLINLRENEIQTLLQSRSWRWTKPLRLIEHYTQQMIQQLRGAVNGKRGQNTL